MKLGIYISTFFALSTNPKVELGKTLFFDQRLSGNNKVSCASCHNPDKGWSDGRSTALGYDGTPLLRKTPTIAYLDDDKVLFWDGRASSLEEQAITPITAPNEMNQNIDELIRELDAVPEYVEVFNRIYPLEGISEKTILSSIAAFERSLNRRDSPFDRYMAGNVFAISEDAKKGHSIMSSLKSNCMFCHKGNDFNDQKLWDVGVDGLDSGYNQGFLFKTPTLRDVATRAPYFHNGSKASLEEVVRFYARGGDVHRPGQSAQQRPKIKLTDFEIYQIVEFLKTLTTDNRDFKRPNIP